MKLIIQIPCLNEAETLGATVAHLPRHIDGVDLVEFLVIDDGSTDDTSRVAAQVGVDHVVRLPENQGLATAFAIGIEACLDRGADIIVNTDGDNQYLGSSVGALVAPLLDGGADIVIGDRDAGHNPEFSRSKRLLQRWGSRVVASIADAPLTDAFSGFRAYSRAAAQQLQVMSDFSYTVETLIGAGHSDLRIVSVPVQTNPVARPSRLAASPVTFVRHQSLAMLRFGAMHRARRLLLACAALMVVTAIAFAISGSALGTAAMAAFGVLFVSLSVIADLLEGNRRLLQKSLRVASAAGAGDGDSLESTTAIPPAIALAEHRAAQSGKRRRDDQRRRVGRG